MPVKIPRRDTAPAAPSSFGPRYDELLALLKRETDARRMKELGDEMLAIVEADRRRLAVEFERLLGKK